MMAEAQNSMIMSYTQNEKKKIQMEVLCVSLAVPTRQLQASDLNEQVGKLAGIQKIEPLDRLTLQKAPALFCMPEIIIFSRISDNKLDEFLLSYKKLGLSPTKLKAVTTPKNVSWTLYQLIKELMSEHEKLKSF